MHPKWDIRLAYKVGLERNKVENENEKKTLDFADDEQSGVMWVSGWSVSERAVTFTFDTGHPALRHPTHGHNNAI